MDALNYVCLDSIVLIDMARGFKSAKDMIEELLVRPYRLATTAITVFETALRRLSFFEI